MGTILQGIVHVTGEHDVGKTSFALECGAAAERIFFVDADAKGRATASALSSGGYPLGGYVDFLAQARGMTQLQAHDLGRKILASVKPGKYDAFIWDAWEVFTATLKPYVREHMQEFRHPQDWSPMGQFKGAQQWAEAHNLEAALLSELQEKVPLVIVTTHLKNFYVESRRVPGVQIPAATSTLERLPRLRLWLKHNPTSPVPVGLVLKRLDIRVNSTHGVRTLCVLPRKLTPNVRLPGEEQEPHDLSLWDTIARYMLHPFDNREPLPEETPSAEDLATIEGSLTKEQMQVLMLALQVPAGGEDDLIALSAPAEPATPDERIPQARELRDTGSSLPEIAAKLGATVPEVARWLA